MINRPPLVAALLALILPAVLPAQHPARPTAHAPFTRACAIKVDVVDGIATTALTATIHNPGARQAEAVWVLPLPEGAVADAFEMTMNGKRVQGDVLQAGQARAVYEGIVRRRRDPGLLEYVGRGCLRACVFPIPAGGDMDVEVRWRQVLPELAGLVRFTMPLATTGLDGQAPANVTLDLTLRSTKSIRNAFSPTPGVDIAKKDDHSLRASFESAGGAPPKELALFYGLSEKEFGLNLLTWQKGAEDGYFAMLVAPKRDWDDTKILPRSITFVLDTSGSMRGQKIAQARAALQQFIGSLRDVDRFNVVPFSTEPRPFYEQTVAASEKNRADALERVKRIEASGGTNIGDALAAGIPDAGPDGEHVPICVFLSDGAATVGVVDREQLVERAHSVNAETGARIFVFGVGDEVNTNLLDRIAQDSGGTRHYVRENEAIEEKTSDLFAKLSNPVLSDVQLTIDGVETTRVVPARLPDMFRGSRLMIVGRYRGDGAAVVRLRGRSQGVQREYVYEPTFAAGATDHAFVRTLWAERRVGVLLDAIRLNGENAELMEEVRRLGTEFRIVTPYTSHLILEEGLAIDSRRYRGPGDTAPPGGGGGRPGPAGPATPGARGPTTGGPTGPAGAVVTGSDSFFMGTGKLGQAELKVLAERLRTAGVLPKDTPDEQLVALARKVAGELFNSAQGLGGLGKKDTGRRAVDDSAYLAKLVGGARRGDDSALLELFSRKVEDKVFLLREGVWTDRTYDAEKMGDKKRVIEAFSTAYFELSRERPEIRPFLALGERVLVVLDDVAYEIAPAAGETAETGDRGNGRGDA